MGLFIEDIVGEVISQCLPDKIVEQELSKLGKTKGKTIIISIGKASYQMAKAVTNYGFEYDQGIVITKYNHLFGDIEKMECYEAGHPIPDSNSIKATDRAIELVSDLTEDDLVIMLISGGGSALFESPIIDLKELENITHQMLSRGADINEINTIRKRLSKVKGGKFAKIASPAKVYNIILSDVLSNRADVIASGPTSEDISKSDEAIQIVKKYNLDISDSTLEVLKSETVNSLNNVTTIISGSTEKLCLATKNSLEERGYAVDILTSTMNCEAREAGSLIGSIAKYKSNTEEKKAYIFGGETVVNLKGEGKGGRNQEIAFAACKQIHNIENVMVASFSSDGTDGPTDASGAYSTGDTYTKLNDLGIRYDDVINNSDTYTAFKKINQLIVTGPTGTNINDVSIILINWGGVGWLEAEIYGLKVWQTI